MFSDKNKARLSLVVLETYVQSFTLELLLGREKNGTCVIALVTLKLIPSAKAAD